MAPAALALPRSKTIHLPIFHNEKTADYVLPDSRIRMHPDMVKLAFRHIVSKEQR